MGFQCIPSPVIQDGLLFACSGENTMAIRLDGTTGELTKSHVVWKNKKASAFLASPLAFEGQLYIPGDKGFVSCFDAKTSKLQWKERLGASSVASRRRRPRLLHQQGRRRAQCVRAGPTYDLLSENDVGESLVASPALSQNRIFLRGEKHLYCIQEK